MLVVFYWSCFIRAGLKKYAKEVLLVSNESWIQFPWNPKHLSNFVLRLLWSCFETTGHGLSGSLMKVYMQLLHITEGAFKIYTNTREPTCFLQTFHMTHCDCEHWQCIILSLSWIFILLVTQHHLTFESYHSPDHKQRHNGALMSLSHSL